MHGDGHVRLRSLRALKTMKGRVLLMRTFFAVLKNDYLRLLPRMMAVVAFTAFTLAAIFSAVYITGLQQVKAHIVFIPQSTSVAAPRSSKALDVTTLPEKPPLSSLMEQKYDAYVTADGDGNYQIETLRNDEFRNLLSVLLRDPEADISGIQTKRGVGVNIVGFMMMFLLMIAFFNLFTFADDKEQGQLKRIAASPASFGSYFAAHCVYSLSMLLPEYLMLVILQRCGWDIGFSLLQYAGLMAALAFLGISFALLLNTLIKKPDNANMLGNSVTVLSSILAGSFYSLSRKNAVLDGIIQIIPQKNLMDFAQDLQNGCASEHAGRMLYVVVFSLALFVISCVVLRRMYVKKVGSGSACKRPENGIK
jgi:ABC-2 type transport system permease protein